MAVPEEVPRILQVVSEYLKEPCPITSLSGSQGPTHPEGPENTLGKEGERDGMREAHQVGFAEGEDCVRVCWSLCVGVCVCQWVGLLGAKSVKTLH